ncbi:enzymatic polyprotein [Elysia marginata]|uniref:Enzymatic polyprotein n=1 Tax=Elysia marginata TaxID=1093978 RepID=A0AAV4I9S8_9GAST|nr:enzymatic polyprotein [Elysia marginata]
MISTSSLPDAGLSLLPGSTVTDSWGLEDENNADKPRTVPPNTRKTTFDAWNGYPSIALDPKDRHLTTFITPRGRYRYCVYPQGYLASREAAEWLELCGHNGIVLNPTKFTFAKETVEFAGFEITPTTVTPCPQAIEAIKRFPTPRNITDVRSWFGLVNQVSYAFASAEIMQPFRNLLKTNTKFSWTDSMDELFEETKVLITEEIRHWVEIFDKTRPTCLSTDFSKDGIGFWLLQKHCTCESKKPLCCRSGWKITLVGSCFTSSAES